MERHGNAGLLKTAIQLFPWCVIIITHAFFITILGFMPFKSHITLRCEKLLLA